MTLVSAFVEVLFYFYIVYRYLTSVAPFLVDIFVLLLHALVSGGQNVSFLVQLTLEYIKNLEYQVLYFVPFPNLISSYFFT